MGLTIRELWVEPYYVDWKENYTPDKLEDDMGYIIKVKDFRPTEIHGQALMCLEEFNKKAIEEKTNFLHCVSPYFSAKGNPSIGNNKPYMLTKCAFMDGRYDNYFDVQIGVYSLEELPFAICKTIYEDKVKQ